jgi:hypothetical protein
LSRQTSYIFGTSSREMRWEMDVTWIDVTLFYAFQQRFHVIVRVRLTHLHGDTLAKRCSKMNLSRSMRKKSR